MIVHTQQLDREAFFAEQPPTGEPQVRGPLPPAERDFAVFERVVIEGGTTRAAAAEFGLSQTRIVQIRQRVAEWIGSEVPPTDSLSPQQRLRLAASIAEQRIHFLYSQAMEAWRASQGSQSHGDVRYLAAAARIAGMPVRLAVSVERAGRGQETGDGRRVHERSEMHQAGPHASQVHFVRDGLTHPAPEAHASRSPGPPVEDCSRFAASQAAPLSVVAEETDETHCRPEVSDEIERRRRAFLAALADDTSPVQPPHVDAGGLQLDTPQEATEDQPEQPLGEVLQLRLDVERPTGGVTIHRPLTRAERKARQRLLDRKLRARRAK